MKKRILSFALALCFVLTLLPAAFADSAPTSGTCGDNLTWRLNGSVLTISGKEDMDDYDDFYLERAPWYEYKDRIIMLLLSRVLQVSVTTHSWNAIISNQLLFQAD